MTEALDIPTIGIGAGPHCDGQVLVVDDVLGRGEGTPPFARAWGDVRGEMRRAVEGFVADVESGAFPGEEHSHYEDGLDAVQR